MMLMLSSKWDLHQLESSCHLHAFPKRQQSPNELTPPPFLWGKCLQGSCRVIRLTRNGLRNHNLWKFCKPVYQECGLLNYFTRHALYYLFCTCIYVHTSVHILYTLAVSWWSSWSSSSYVCHQTTTTDTTSSSFPQGCMDFGGHCPLCCVKKKEEESAPGRLLQCKIISLKISVNKEDRPTHNNEEGFNIAESPIFFFSGGTQ